MDEGKNGASLIREGETSDEILGGRLKVIQRKRGYRFSVDSLLLTHFIGPGKGCHILDLGTGSGIIALILSYLRPGSRIVGIELQDDLADMAKRTLTLNGLSDTMEIIAGNVRQINELLPTRSFDMVVANPPYRRINSGRINPDGQKARARHEIDGSLNDFMMAAAYSLKPGGKLCLIYPVRRMVEAIHRMRLNHIEPKRCRMVHSHPESRGEFILIEGTAGGREEMTVEPPLYIYDGEDRYSETMQVLFSDLASSL
ncbi:MAG: methyltransferase [Syntrophales bacterium]|nr:methyltransferase [Syntrophales bacterium]